MKELIEYMTSGFWVFVGTMLILEMLLRFILIALKRSLWTKREYIEENERLKSKIEDLEGEKES